MSDPSVENTAETEATESVTESLVSPVTESTEELLFTLEDWFMQLVTGQEISPLTAKLLVVLTMFVLAGLVFFIVRMVIVSVIRKIVVRTRTKWDDCLVSRRFFTRIAHLAPAVVIFLYAPLFDNELVNYGPFLAGDGMEQLVQLIAKCYMILVGVLVGCAFVNAISDIYQSIDVSQKNPIYGFVQGAKLVLWIIGGLLLAAVITGKEPWTLVAGIGAITAVIMLVFRDTILGFVASIQIFINDMLHVGDWIEMPKYGIDGDVTSINLTTIVVKNFDNTTTTVPTYAVIAESFKNWRGMQESGGRRIKRAIHIDMNSITFCSDEMVERFRRFSLLSDYIQQKLEEVDDYNKQHGIDMSEIINGRRLTNFGTFRAYLNAYLVRHEQIHKGMTFLIRQLAPSEKGIPIEIYVFCKDTRWVNYETIQADIFDHVLAVIPEFGLRVFQNPTGSDFTKLASAVPLQKS